MFTEYLTPILSIMVAIGAVLTCVVRLRRAKSHEQLHKKQLSLKDDTIKSKDEEIKQLTTTIEGLERKSPIKRQQQYERYIKQLEGEIVLLQERIGKQSDKLIKHQAQTQSDKKTTELLEEEVILCKRQLNQLEKERAVLQEQNDILIKAIYLLNDESPFKSIDDLLRRFGGDRADLAIRQARAAAQARAFASAGPVIAEAPALNQLAQAAVEREKREKGSEKNPGGSGVRLPQLKTLLDGQEDALD
jgi:hypothetical protein